ncbi:MAG: N-6 DNA methylase [Pseudomonadota bacterium]|nr:N-6 DNA methylase [Pseudomonadota bacterium]
MRVQPDPSERFAGELRAAEDRLRAAGLGGRRAFVALARHLAARLGLAPELWPDGPDAPPSAQLERLPLSPELDLFGLAYERFFSDLWKGERGQFFTPRPLVELVADLAQLRPGDRVLDPTCGSGGFLVAALARGADPDGIEVDPDLVALARLNVALHGGNPRAVVAADFFAAPDDGDRWDAILANPPFSVEVSDPQVLRRYALADGRARVGSDILFVEAALARLKPGGRLVTVLPYTVLSGAPFAGARAWIDAVAVREAVVSLPEGMFRPFGGTPTRACVVALRKRPAEVRPMLAAVIENPGYDTRRQTFRRTEPDELVGLRMHLRGAAYARASRVPDAGWIPEEALATTAIAPGVPVFSLGDRADLVKGRTPFDPGAPVTVVDFADVDKGTGEVVDARVEPAGACDGVPFQEGDLLFGRMRPELNNVVLATRPRAGLPEQMAGSGEWVRLRPRGQAAFTLLALRSRFARDQLVVTGGQTRPRARVEDIAGLALPDPGPAARAALDALLTETYAERLRLRQRLAAVDTLYERFGRGELDADALLAAVATLRAEP